MIENIKTVGEIVLGSALLLYLVDIFRQRWKHKRLIIKLKKEVAFELFTQEMVLISIISDFNLLLDNPLAKTSAHWFSLNITNSILSSGQFVHFDYEFNDFLFRMLTQFKKIHFELDSFMRLADLEKEHNMRLLDSGRRHSIEAFEKLQKSKIYKELKTNYLKEWSVYKKDEVEFPTGFEMPTVNEILDIWENTLREIAGIPKSNQNKG